MMQLGAKVNLVICQKSKIDDWLEHFRKYYQYEYVYNLTDKIDYNEFELLFLTLDNDGQHMHIGVINYELAFRRPELKEMQDFTLMLDESSMIQNENAERSKFILSLNAKNVILLSGTPTSGKYENLWSQLHLLGWPISKKMYWNQYIDTEVIDNEGYPITVVKGYKNVERLKRKMRQYGCNFLKTDEVFDLPEQIDQTIRINTTKEYRKFRKNCVVTLKNVCFVEPVNGDGYCNYTEVELVGDTTLTKMLYERQLCGQYNRDKLDAVYELFVSTNDRIIVFYNFTVELEMLLTLAESTDKFVSVVNGNEKDLEAYEDMDDSITFIQYQAGAMGLNLQKANKIVYFTPPLSSDLFEQSKKRIHRIGQDKPCFYYYLTCKNSIEEKIYNTLAMRKDYTDTLFESEGDV